MLHSIQIEDFMTENPVTFRPDTELFEAVHTLLERKLSGATVVDEDGHVVGVVSEMDLLKAVEAISYYNEGGGQVNDYMTTEVAVIDGHMNIYDAANKLLALNMRRLPVVEDNKFIGQVSCRSILQAMKDSLYTVPRPQKPG